ncbi:ketoacyl-synthetase C-terminal extension domain-containing protein, partial [Streptomyces sp. NRRL F-5635]
GRARRAAVSSFGISGTNAHIILEDAPPVEAPQEAPTVVLPVVPWVVSGHSVEALHAQIEQLTDAAEDLPRLDVGVSLVSRAALRHRAVSLGAGFEWDPDDPRVDRLAVVFP